MDSSSFPGGSVSKESARNAGDCIQSPVCKDPLEKEMATHSSILAWRIPWTEEPGVTKSWTGLGDQLSLSDLESKGIAGGSERTKLRGALMRP